MSFDKTFHSKKGLWQCIPGFSKASVRLRRLCRSDIKQSRYRGYNVATGERGRKSSGVALIRAGSDFINNAEASRGSIRCAHVTSI